MILWFSVLLCLCVSVVLLFCFSVALFVYLLPFLCSSVSVSFSSGPPLLVESHSTRTDSKSFSGVGPRRGKAGDHCIGDKGNVHLQVLFQVYECVVLMYLGFFSWLLLLCFLQKLEKCSMELGSVLEENEALKNEFVQLHQRHRDNERTVTM